MLFFLSIHNVMWEICAQGGMFASCIWILSNIGFLRLWSEMIVLVMLIMNDHNHVNGDYHIVKMITSIIMLRTMIMTVIGNALECLAAVCLLAFASIVFLATILIYTLHKRCAATSLLYSWFCISALHWGILQKLLLHPLLPNDINAASVCIFALT